MEKIKRILSNIEYEYISPMIIGLLSCIVCSLIGYQIILKESHTKNKAIIKEINVKKKQLKQVSNKIQKAKRVKKETDPIRLNRKKHYQFLQQNPVEYIHTQFVESKISNSHKKIAIENNIKFTNDEKELILANAKRVRTFPYPLNEQPHRLFSKTKAKIKIENHFNIIGHS